jgi:hypothetical protein
VDDVIGADKAVLALCRFMADRDEWKGTATDLLAALVDHVKQPQRHAEAAHAKEVEEGDPKGQVHSAARLREVGERARETLGKDWPKAPHALIGRLKRAGDALRKTSVHIVWPSRHGDEKRIAISNTCPPALRNKASQASQPPQTDGDLNHSGGKGWDASLALRDAQGRSAQDQASPEKALGATTDASFSGGRDAWDASLRASTCGDALPAEKETLWRGLT